MDPDSHVATEIWVAFLSLVRIDAQARELNTAAHLRVTRLCREILQGMANAGQIAPGADLDLETSLLQALFDGIALHAVTVPEQVPPTRIRQLLAHHLDRLRQS